MNSSLKNDLLINALAGKKNNRPPIWLMRQAGRILPQYRAIRSKLSGFKALIANPEIACEVTIQPVDELGVDAAIIFSDILVVPEAMGLNYELVEKKGPLFERTVKNERDVADLKIADLNSNLADTIKAIELTVAELNGRVPLIGFAGAPWTIFCYMIEGKGSKDFKLARRMLYEQPELSKQLLTKITDSTIVYLNAQIAAGCSAIQLFDSWLGVLSEPLFLEFVKPEINRIAKAVNGAPKIYFPKGGHFIHHHFNDLHFDGFSTDWNMPIEQIRQNAPNKTLQGNFDPAILYSNPSHIKKSALQMIEKFGDQRYIANLGHGVYPDTPLDNVKCFVDTVKAYAS